MRIGYPARFYTGSGGHELVALGQARLPDFRPEGRRSGPRVEPTTHGNDRDLNLFRTGACGTPRRSTATRKWLMIGGKLIGHNDPDTRNAW